MGHSSCLDLLLLGSLVQKASTRNIRTGYRTDSECGMGLGALGLGGEWRMRIRPDCPILLSARTFWSLVYLWIQHILQRIIIYAHTDIMMIYRIPLT